MEYFLEQVAGRLLEKYGTDLKRHCLVFPNRRAGLFLVKHLAAKVGKPIWAPKTITINELFSGASSLKIAPTERLVFELFKLYVKHARADETIDNFYFWGEMLVNDFDDIDKYLVDAGALFTNLSDLHEIDDKFGGLTQEQIEIVRKFIRNFRTGKESEQKRDFEFNWSVLSLLYTEFNSRLRENGLAYEGMVARDLAGSDDIAAKYFKDFDQYHFVGFNALNNCERKVMRSLKAAQKAEFYWDYNDSPFFGEDPKSVLFLRQNIGEMGQSLPAPDNSEGFISVDNKGGQARDLFSGSHSEGVLPEIDIIGVPTDSGQAKLLPRILAEVGAMDPRSQHKTAVVLADENMLPTILSSIPPEITDINITMGYPFKMTVAYSLLRSLLSIQERPVVLANKTYFDYKKVLDILSNPLIKSTIGELAMAMTGELASKNMSLVSPGFFADNPFLTTLFTVVTDSKALCGYLREVFLSIASALDPSKVNADGPKPDPLVPEFLFRANQVLNRMEPVLSDPSVVVSREIGIRLLDKVFREIKVPFRGEPLKGLQIMGLLESRALDFDNLIVLSANEGILPKSSASSSYIPYNLREAFGLPVVTHQDSIYSYYFNRLLVRAKKITLVYNSSSEGLRSGEMSRFLLRMKYSDTIKPRFISTRVSISRNRVVEQSVPRSPLDVKILEDRYLTGEKVWSLSPSALNTWLSCRRKFYYSYLCDMKEPEGIADGVDPRLLGTLIHEAINRIYSPYKGRVMTRETVMELKKMSVQNRATVEAVMHGVWFGGETEVPVTGNMLVITDIASMYLNRIFDIDAGFAPFTVIDLEGSYHKDIVIEYDGGPKTVKLGGKIDRIDERNGVRRLIDYKTGKAELSVNQLEGLFDYGDNKINDAVTQTLVYCSILSGSPGYSRMRPVVYALRRSGNSVLNDYLEVGGEPLEDFSAVEPVFMPLLLEAIGGIFDKNLPFSMTSDEKRCQYCPYKNICKR